MDNPQHSLDAAAMTVKRLILIVAPLAFAASIFAAPWMLTFWIAVIVIALLLLIGGCLGQMARP